MCVERIYIDTDSKVAHIKRQTNKMPITATDRLNDRRLLFRKKSDLPVLCILTDRRIK
jgi:hypothetical protein